MEVLRTENELLVDETEFLKDEHKPNKYQTDQLVGEMETR